MTHLKKNSHQYSLSIIILSYLVLVIFIGKFSFDQSYKKGFEKGKSDQWNQKAEADSLPLGKLLNHYTYEYRLSGTITGIDKNSITVKKGQTTRTFGTGLVSFILGDKRLSLEDNIFATPGAQLRPNSDLTQSFKIGDEVILVTRARNAGGTVILTQVIKMQ